MHPTDKPIGIGVLGYGTIGTAVIEYFLDKKPDGLKIKSVLIRDPAKPRTRSMPLTTSLDDIIHDDDIQIVVELLDGNKDDKAYNAIRQALEQKKSVVTANKAVMSKYLVDLITYADTQDVSIAFEASVCGSVPIIRTLNEFLRYDDITSITGVVNGTCNFILSEMMNGNSFDAALKVAQSRGYAESDPTLDLDGTDSLQKLAILGSLAFSREVPPTQLYQCGLIDKAGTRLLDPADFYFAKREGYTIKLIGCVRREDDTIVGGVFPAFVPTSHTLSTVTGSFNGLVIDGDLIQSHCYIGPGAGGAPTASAVISDIFDVSARIRGEFPLCYGIRERGLSLGNFEDSLSEGYVRSYSPNIPGGFAQKLGILSQLGVNVNSAINVEGIVRPGTDADETPDFIQIFPAKNRVMRKALDNFSDKGVHDPFFLRMVR
ncbi:homoserine dehydrogenase [Candidatus Woesearchaeota archaeon]|nr:homoserine dehydrogenase [Candidatus Woesearchaeota archaeon]